MAGTGTVLIIAGATAVILGLRRLWWELGFLAVAFFIEFSVFLTTVTLIDRPRPSVPKLDGVPSTSSFPSGHVAAAIVLYVGLAVLISSRTRHLALKIAVWALAVALVISVGVSRVYRGLHHPLDVFAGVVLGTGAILFAILAIRAAVADSRLRTEEAIDASAFARERGPRMTSVAVLAHTGKSLGGGLVEFAACSRMKGSRIPSGTRCRRAGKHRRRFRLHWKRVRTCCSSGAATGWSNAASTRSAATCLPCDARGTANLLAKNLGIPKDISKAVRIGLHGARRKLDTGVINGERFAVMAGVGIDAMMIHDADSGLKDRVGRVGYIVTGAKHLRDPQTRMHVKVEGAHWFKGKASCVLFGNVGKVLGGMTVFPDASPDDGALEIGVVTAKGVMEWGRALGRTMLGDQMVHRSSGQRRGSRSISVSIGRSRTRSMGATAQRRSDSGFRSSGLGVHLCTRERGGS